MENGILEINNTGAYKSQMFKIRLTERANMLQQTNDETGSDQSLSTQHSVPGMIPGPDNKFLSSPNGPYRVLSPPILLCNDCWEGGLSQSGLSLKLTIHIHLAPKLIISGATPPGPYCIFTSDTGKKSNFRFLSKC